MSAKRYTIKKAYRRLKRAANYFAKRKNRRKVWRYVLMAGATALVVALCVSGRTMQHANYTALLDVIAAGESKGNYNAYYGNAGNVSIDFTTMTMRQVLAWQATYVQQGNPSNAVGKYQFIRPTLLGLVREMKISESERFDAALQDRLAIRLIERRGVRDYMNGRMSREQLAHNLSMEWAALPRVIGDNPEASYYDGDGLNKVQVRVDQILAAIDSLRASA